MNAARIRDQIYQKFVKAGAPSITLSKVIKGTFNVTTGSISNTTVDYSTHGFITDYSLYSIDGTLIKSGDKKLLLAISPGMATPDSTDIILIDTDTWNVVTCKPVMPTNIPILFVVQVRQ